MKLKNFNILIFVIYLISFSNAYSIGEQNIKNIIQHKKPKKIDYIEFYNSKNEVFTLNNFKSDLVIVNFWATWCLPCREEMPSLSKLKKKLLKIDIIPINIGGESFKKSEKFYKELNIKNLNNFNGEITKLSKVFRLRGLPTTVLINKNGEEFARIIGSIDFEDKDFLTWLEKQI